MGQQPTDHGPDLARQANHPAVRPFTNCSNCMTRLAVLYFMNVPSLQLRLLLTYEELLMRNCTV